jgi:hypothetical protein
MACRTAADEDANTTVFDLAGKAGGDDALGSGGDGTPDFHRIGRPMLHGETSIPVTYIAFDVLALEGEPTLSQPYAERHALLEEITIDGPQCVVEVVGSFDDGPALWDAIVARGLEGACLRRCSGRSGWTADH